VDGLDVDGASISLLTASDARQTRCATDPVAELLEDLQFTFDEGPCMQAAVTGNPCARAQPASRLGGSTMADLHRRGDRTDPWIMP
jgi:hypothetical protein